MANQNCWEFKKCERQVGGKKVSELGICPASTETKQLSCMNCDFFKKVKVEEKDDFTSMPD